MKCSCMAMHRGIVESFLNGMADTRTGYALCGFPDNNGPLFDNDRVERLRIPASVMA